MGGISPAADGVEPELGRSSPLQPLPAQRPLLSQMVFDAIREAILSRHFMPGDRLTEASLARELNVSKTPVREALQQLQHVRLVEPSGRRGVRIVMPSAERISYAYEVREGLEVQAARLSAERATQKDHEIIRYAASQAAHAADDGDFDRVRLWDQEFHKAVAEASGNPQLAQLVHDFAVQTWTLRMRDAPTRDHSRAHHHETLAEHIMAGRTEDAAIEMAHHVRATKEAVLAAFGAPAQAHRY